MVTKHANLSLCEWLALTYHERGIRVSCICPLGMRTGMLKGDHDASSFGESTVISAEEAAALLRDFFKARR